MALFKPETTQAQNFMGVQEVAIVGFNDRSNEFDWADVYLEVELKPQNSKYTNKMQIKGSFEFGPNGDIVSNSLIRRIYNLFDAFNADIGVNLKGEWEDSTGAPIKEIDKFLDTYFAQNEARDDLKYNYLAYFFKEKSKKNGKIYTRVWPKLYKNETGQRTELLDFVEFLKSKGLIKDVVQSTAVTNPTSIDSDIL